MSKKEHKYAAFGKLVRSQRKLKYGDIKAFSQATGISIKDLYGYEAGRTFPPIEKFISICKALDRTPSYMLIPLIDMQQEEQELIQFLHDNHIREIYEDPEITNILKFALSILQLVYYARKHTNIEGSIIDNIHFLTNSLFSEGNYKKLS